MSEIIPVMHCFNDNYVVPAAVSFNSMLKRADKDYFYRLFVLHTDITPEHQRVLTEMVGRYENASLSFIDMHGKFDDLFAKTNTKGHYSKEMYYKFVAPEVFKEYDKIIITDVDVVFLGDIAKDFVAFDCSSDDYLAAFRGCWRKRKPNEKAIDVYGQEFTPEEKEKLIFGGGYYIYNLRKMRQENCQQRFIEWINENCRRVKQPEQDTINMVCHPAIKTLPVNAVVCTYLYRMYQNEKDYSEDVFYSAEDVRYALAHPVQLHYAGADKPWLFPAVAKSEVWFRELFETPFVEEYLQQLDMKMNGAKVRRKILASIKLPFSKKKLLLMKEKTVG